MTSLSYPQMMQGLQLQTNEPHSIHDSSLINPLGSMISADRSNLSLAHFYHESISKTSINNNEQNATTSLHNQNENFAFRTMSNAGTKPIEII